MGHRSSGRDLDWRIAGAVFAGSCLISLALSGMLPISTVWVGGAFTFALPYGLVLAAGILRRSALPALLLWCYIQLIFLGIPCLTGLWVFRWFWGDFLDEWALPIVIAYGASIAIVWLWVILGFELKLPALRARHLAGAFAFASIALISSLYGWRTRLRSMEPRLVPHDVQWDPGTDPRDAEAVTSRVQTSALSHISGD